MDIVQEVVVRQAGNFKQEIVVPVQHYAIKDAIGAILEVHVRQHLIVNTYWNAGKKKADGPRTNQHSGTGTITNSLMMDTF